MSLEPSPATVPALPTAARTLADFTGPGLMIPHLRGGESASAIKELTEALQSENRVPDALPFYQAVLNREFLAGTAFEAGMAVPHARMAGLGEVSFALGRSERSLRWGAQGAGSVRLVFLMAVPATDATQYLVVISGLARLSKDARLMARLMEASTAAQMMEVLGSVGLGGPARSDTARAVA